MGFKIKQILFEFMTEVTAHPPKAVLPTGEAILKRTDPPLIYEWLYDYLYLYGHQR